MTSSAGPVSVDTSRRYAPLDGLRALAALAVVGFHLDLKIARGGAVGVDWFFVLSGYLIATVLLRAGAGTGTTDLVRFYRRRVRRLVPALIGLVVVVLAVIAVGYRAGLGDAAREGLAAVLYVTNMTDLGASGRHEFFLHTWTLALEMQFYLVLPVLMMVVHRTGWSNRRIARLCVALAVTIVAARTVGAMSSDRMPMVLTWPLFDLDRFLFGIALAYALPDPSSANVRAAMARRTPAMACLVVILADIFLGQYWPDRYPSLHQLVICPAVAVVIGHVLVAPRDLVARGLALRPLAAIGLISYSLYLWHFPIFELLRNGVVFEGHGALRNLSKLPLAFAAACISYALLERPFLRRPISARYPGPASPAGSGPETASESDVGPAGT